TIAEGDPYKGEWVQLRTAPFVQIGRMIMQARKDGAVFQKRCPFEFVLLGSTNNGNTWDKIYKSLVQPEYASNEQRSFQFTQSKPYNLFRLVCQKISITLDGFVSLNKVEFFGAKSALTYFGNVERFNSQKMAILQ